MKQMMPIASRIVVIVFVAVTKAEITSCSFFWKESTAAHFD